MKICAGKVQMIYIDPPYGIKYDSNFQQRVDSTTNDDNDEADDVFTIRRFGTPGRSAFIRICRTSKNASICAENC